MTKAFIAALILAASAPLTMAQTGGVPGQPKPIKADQVAGNDGTNLRVLKTDTAGQLIVTGPTGSSANQVQGTAATGATAVGNPVQTGGVFNTTPATLTNGQQGAFQLDNAQLLLTKVQGMAAVGAALVGNPLYVGGVFNTTPATITNGQQGALQLDSGQLLLTKTQGMAAVGVAAVGNPNLLGGTDSSGNVRVPRYNAAGTPTLGAQNAATDGRNNALGVGPLDEAGNSGQGLYIWPWVYNGGTTTAWDRMRSASLANFPTAQTTTAVNSIGAQLFEKGARWAKTSAPAAGTAASASITSEASVRHVVDCVSWSADSSGAVTAANAVITVRDGASGAGTVLWQWVVSLPTAGALGVQEIVPVSHCGLNLVGTTATAMTVEFSTGVANVLMTANMSGYNVN